MLRSAEFFNITDTGLSKLGSFTTLLKNGVSDDGFPSSNIFSGEETSSSSSGKISSSSNWAYL